MQRATGLTGGDQQVERSGPELNSIPPARTRVVPVKGGLHVLDQGSAPGIKGHLHARGQVLATVRQEEREVGDRGVGQQTPE